MVSDFKPEERLKNINPSGIRRFFALAQGMAHVIDLSVGEPDSAPLAVVRYWVPSGERRKNTLRANQWCS